jgi:GNAT superfamily N-acetyltransferase
VQSGLTEEGLGCAPFDASAEVIYGEREDGEVGGAVCFERRELHAELRVTLAYVEPTSRKLGVFTSLFEALKAEAHKHSLSRIVGEVHPDNEAMQAVKARLGGQVVPLTYETLIDR